MLPSLFFSNSLSSVALWASQGKTLFLNHFWTVRISNFGTNLKYFVRSAAELWSVVLRTWIHHEHDSMQQIESCLLHSGIWTHGNIAVRAWRDCRKFDHLLRRCGDFAHHPIKYHQKISCQLWGSCGRSWSSHRFQLQRRITSYCLDKIPTPPREPCGDIIMFRFNQSGIVTVVSRTNISSASYPAATRDAGVQGSPWFLACMMAKFDPRLNSNLKKIKPR